MSFLREKTTPRSAVSPLENTEKRHGQRKDCIVRRSSRSDEQTTRPGFKGTESLVFLHRWEKHARREYISKYLLKLTSYRLANDPKDFKFPKFPPLGPNTTLWPALILVTWDLLASYSALLGIQSLLIHNHKPKNPPATPNSDARSHSNGVWEVTTIDTKPREPESFHSDQDAPQFAHCNQTSSGKWRYSLPTYVCFRRAVMCVRVRPPRWAVDRDNPNDDVHNQYYTPKSRGTPQGRRSAMRPERDSLSFSLSLDVTTNSGLYLRLGGDTPIFEQHFVRVKGGSCSTRRVTARFRTGERYPFSCRRAYTQPTPTKSHVQVSNYIWATARRVGPAVGRSEPPTAHARNRRGTGSYLRTAGAEIRKALLWMRPLSPVVASAWCWFGSMRSFELPIDGSLRGELFGFSATFSLMSPAETFVSLSHVFVIGTCESSTPLFSCYETEFWK